MESVIEGVLVVSAIAAGVLAALGVAMYGLAKGLNKIDEEA